MEGKNHIKGYFAEHIEASVNYQFGAIWSKIGGVMQVRGLIY